MTANVPLYFAELRGDSRQRGIQHGTVLKQSIARAIEFYRHFFAEYLGMDAEEMRRRAARFIEPTARSFREARFGSAGPGVVSAMIST